MPAERASSSESSRPPRPPDWTRSRHCATNSRAAVPILVAHRGDAARYPENTLAAFASAARLGLHYVELDVQITADGIPLVLHDDTLTRTHGFALRVTSATLRELARRGVLTDGARPPAIPRLAEFAAWLAGHPGMHAFVELKKESLRASGRPRMLDAVAEALRAIRTRTVLISYDASVLAMAKRRGYEVGYVLPGLSRLNRSVAARLAPHILFVERRQLLRRGKLWPGPWRWAVFEVGSPETASALSRLGVHFLESMDPARLLSAGIGVNQPGRGPGNRVRTSLRK